MSFINYMAREINCKIVYYGPGLCGKTTNLQYIYERTNPDAKGKMISLATETERTLFFDFLPLSLGEIKGFKTRFHLYTVPGQVFYDASRKLILKGVDGVIFVADSQEARMEANIESIKNLEANLQAQGYELEKVPYVLQLNKRDLPTPIPASMPALILFITADLAQLRRVGELLAENDCTVVHGGDGAEVSLDPVPDLVLLDTSLGPGVEAAALVVRIRQTPSPPPLVV